MRRAMLAGVAMLALAGSAQAFDFDTRSFLPVVNTRLAAMGATARLFLLSCQPHDGEFCAYQAGRGLTLDTHSRPGETELDYVGAVWRRAPDGRDAFAQAMVALITLCSPDASAAEREDGIRILFASVDKAAAIETVRIGKGYFIMRATADQVVLNVAEH